MAEDAQALCCRRMPAAALLPSSSNGTRARSWRRAFTIWCSGLGRPICLFAALVLLGFAPGATAIDSAVTTVVNSEGQASVVGRVGELSKELVGDLLKPVESTASSAAGVTSSQSAPTFEPSKVAVCLCGGLRALELVAPSIMKYLFGAYAPADVFIFSTVDADAHKLGLFYTAKEASAANLWHLRSVTINADIPLDDEAPEAAILDPVISGRGILLHSFELIEGCIILVKEWEEKRGGVKYDWVLRARPDSFWSGPAPPMSTMNQSVFSSPAGFEWGGVNDRFAVMGRVIAEDSLTRLSRLNFTLRDYKPPDDTFNEGMVNGEQALKWQLLSHKVPVEYRNFNFCILTKHNWPNVQWPFEHKFPPVFTLSTHVPLNGAYCAPCYPFLTGEDAVDILETAMQGKNLPFHRPRPVRIGWEMCNSARKWPADWEKVFDAQVGPDLKTSRHWYATMDETGCVERLNMTISLVNVYRGPSAYVLCRVRSWEPVFKAAKSGAQASVEHLLEIAASNTMTDTVGVITDVPDLADWSAKNDTWTVQPKTCPVLFTIVGTREQLDLKPQVKERLLSAGLEMLRCGGNFTHEVCLAIYPPKCTG